MFDISKTTANQNDANQTYSDYAIKKNPNILNYTLKGLKHEKKKN